MPCIVIVNNMLLITKTFIFSIYAIEVSMNTITSNYKKFRGAPSRFRDHHNFFFSHLLSMLNVS